MTSTESGIRMVLSDLQSVKVSEPMDVSESGSLMVVNLQPEKALGPIVFNELPKLTDESDSQPEKAP